MSSSIIWTVEMSHGQLHTEKTLVNQFHPDDEQSAKRAMVRYLDHVCSAAHITVTDLRKFGKVDPPKEALYHLLTYQAEVAWDGKLFRVTATATQILC